MPRSLVPELPRVMDMQGPSAWERHRARLRSAGGLYGYLAATRPSAQPAEEDAAARNAKAALMSMSDAMGGDDDDWGAVGMSELVAGAPPALSPPPPAGPTRCTSTPPDWSEFPAESAGVRPVTEGGQSPTRTASRHEGSAVVPSVHERLAAQPLLRGERASDVERRRRLGEARLSTSRSGGRHDPVLAWGYSPSRRSGPSSPAGSSASSMSSGPSSPGATEWEPGGGRSGSGGGRSSPLLAALDERVRMAIFAGDEALAQGRYDAAIAKFEDALGYCAPHTASFKKLQQRLLHARRVQSEVRRVVADWLRTHECVVARNTNSPVVCTSFSDDDTVEAGRRSALLQRRMEAAASTQFSAGPARGCVRPVVRHGSPMHKVSRPHEQRKGVNMGDCGSPFEVPNKAAAETPPRRRDGAFPARLPGAVVSRSAARRPQRAALKSR